MGRFDKESEFSLSDPSSYLTIGSLVGYSIYLFIFSFILTCFLRSHVSYLINKPNYEWSCLKNVGD